VAVLALTPLAWILVAVLHRQNADGIGTYASPYATPYIAEQVALSVAVVAASFVAMRRLSTRPQPADVPTRVAANHAIRSSAVVAVASTGLVAAIQGLLVALAEINFRNGEWPSELRGVMFLAQVFLMIVGLAAQVSIFRSLPRWLPLRPKAPVATPSPAAA